MSKDAMHVLDTIRNGGAPSPDTCEICRYGLAALRRLAEAGAKPALIGRDRVWADELADSLRTDLGELGAIRRTARGSTFEVRYAVDDQGAYIAKVTVELDRVESAQDRSVQS